MRYNAHPCIAWGQAELLLEHGVESAPRTEATGDGDAVDLGVRWRLAEQVGGAVQPRGADQIAGAGTGTLQGQLNLTDRPAQCVGDAGRREVGIACMPGDILPHRLLD